MVHRCWTSAARAIAVVCGLTLALGAYGLETSAAASKAKTKAKVTVATATVPGVGRILVDAKGHALYTLTDANGAAVACTGACAGAWPPLTVKAGAKVKGAKGVKSLGKTADTNQVTSRGLPLYRFSLDTQPKQAKGEGISSFGGTWHVVKVKAAKASTKPTSTTKGTSGSGY
jgi:predicted lipoprotein with Yx(FWY)xxD motif